MSLGTHIKFGAGIGLSTGVITSAYMHGEAKKYEKIFNLLDKESDPACRSAYFMAAYAKYLSEVALATGPFLGAYAGIGLYAVNRTSIMISHAAPRTQNIALAIVAIAVAVLVAERISNKE